ncbi:MAG: hypothetical protein P1U40_12600 [Coxiellaceae bacterium]|nr:hypothetical protein [Coxiellaceae bacterium]
MRDQTTSPSLWQWLKQLGRNSASPTGSDNNDSDESVAIKEPEREQTPSPPPKAIISEPLSWPQQKKQREQKKLTRARSRSRAGSRGDETKDERGRGRRRGRSLSGRGLRQIRSRSQGRASVSFLDRADVVMMGDEPYKRPHYCQQLETETQHALYLKFKMRAEEENACERAIADFAALIHDLRESPAELEKILCNALINEGVVYAAKVRELVSQALSRRHVEQQSAYERGDVASAPVPLPEIFHHNYSHIYLPADLNPADIQQCKQLLLATDAGRIANAITEMEKILGTPNKRYAFRLALWVEAKYYRAKQHVMLVDPKPLTESQQATANAYVGRFAVSREHPEIVFSEVLYKSGYDICCEVISQYYEDRHVTAPSYANTLFSYVDVAEPVLEMYRNQIKLDPNSSAVSSHDLQSWQALAGSVQGGFAKLLAAVSERRRLNLDVLPEKAPSPMPMQSGLIRQQDSLSKADTDAEVEEVKSAVIADSEIVFLQKMRHCRKVLRQRNEKATRFLAVYSDVRGASLIPENIPAFRLISSEAKKVRDGSSNHYHVLRYGARKQSLQHKPRSGVISNAAKFYPLIINCLKRTGCGTLYSQQARDSLAKDLLENPRKYGLRFAVSDASGQARELWQLFNKRDNQTVYAVDAVELQKYNRIVGAKKIDMLEVNTLRQLAFHSLLSKTFDISRRPERRILQPLTVQQHPQQNHEETKVSNAEYETVSVSALRAAFMSLVANKDPVRMKGVFSQQMINVPRSYLEVVEASGNGEVARSFALRVGDRLFQHEFFGVKESLQQLQSYIDVELAHGSEDSEANWLRVLALQYAFYDLSKVLETQIRRRMRFIETVKETDQTIHEGTKRLDWTSVDAILSAQHALALSGLEERIDEHSDLLASMGDTVAKMNLIRRHIQSLALFPFPNVHVALKTSTAERFKKLHSSMKKITECGEQQINDLKQKLGYTAQQTTITWQQLKALRQQEAGRRRSEPEIDTTTATSVDLQASAEQKLATNVIVKQPTFDELTIESIQQLKANVVDCTGIVKQLFDSSSYSRLESRAVQLVTEYNRFNCRSKSKLTTAEIARDNYVTLGMKKADMIYKVLRKLSKYADLESEAVPVGKLQSVLRELEEIDDTEYKIPLMNAEGNIVRLKGFHMNMHRYGNKRDENGVTIPIQSLSSAARLFGSNSCCCISTATRKPLSSFAALLAKTLRKYAASEPTTPVTPTLTAVS